MSTSAILHTSLQTIRLPAKFMSNETSQKTFKQTLYASHKVSPTKTNISLLHDTKINPISTSHRASGRVREKMENCAENFAK